MALPLLVVLATLTSAEPIKLAAPQLQSVGVEPSKAQFFSDYFAQQIAAQGIRVTTTTEIQALIGLEREKQLLTCNESSNCFAELAGALGVDGVITGSVAKTESGSYVVALKVISAKDARPLSLASGRFKTEDAVIDFFTDQGPRIAREVTLAIHPEAAKTAAVNNVVVTPPPPQEEVKTETPGKPWPKAWVPVAVGGALAVAGGTLYVLARGDANRIGGDSSTIATEADLSKAVQSGRSKESIGMALLGAGVGAAASGGALWALGDDAKKKAWIPMAAGGAVVVAGGVLYGLAKGDESHLRGDATDISDPAALSSAINAGRNKEVVGFTLIGAGVGALATGGLTMLLGSDQPAQVSIGASRSGVAFAISRGF